MKYRHKSVGCACLLYALFLFAASTASAGGYTNFIGMQFNQIPPGIFSMGSCNVSSAPKYPVICGSGASEDKSARLDETPKLEIRINKNIQMSIHEVTVDQFMQFAKGNAENTLLQNNDFMRFNSLGGKLPVVYVSWSDAQGFASWLNRNKNSEDSGTYRLATEAEWEYAAKAGSDTIFFYGNSSEQLKKYGWFAGNRLAAGNPHAVGSKLPNHWGIYDLYGNVFEWTLDWYNSKSYEKQSQNNPTGPDSGMLRVIRGGAWNFTAQYCRPAARESYPPNARSRSIGFRVVREINN